MSNSKSHKSNQANSNRGSSGNNKSNSKVHGNRGKQLNPNQNRNK